MLTVTCSVPIRDGPKVIGVLTMSIPLTAFDALKLDRAQKRFALLIDSRADWKGDTGVVLFDGRGIEESSGESTQEAPFEISSATLKVLLASISKGAAASGVIPNFQDPKAGGDKKTAGFAAVATRTDKGNRRFSGWIVVVCESGL